MSAKAIGKLGSPETVFPVVKGKNTCYSFPCVLLESTNRVGTRRLWIPSFVISSKMAGQAWVRLALHYLNPVFRVAKRAWVVLLLNQREV